MCCRLDPWSVTQRSGLVVRGEDERNPSVDRSSASTSKSKSVRSQEAMEVDIALSLETVLKSDFEDNVSQAETIQSPGTKAVNSLKKKGKS